MQMNSKDALRRMVKHYPGGLEVVAMRLGKPAETLRKELAGAPGFKLGQECAELISDMCVEAKSEHCMAFINAIARRGGGFIQLPVVEMPAPSCVRRTMGDVVREMSDVTTTTIEADSDDFISDNDMVRHRKEMEDAYAALQRHDAAMQAKHAAGKRSQG